MMGYGGTLMQYSLLEGTGDYSQDVRNCGDVMIASQGMKEIVGHIYKRAPRVGTN